MISTSVHGCLITEILGLDRRTRISIIICTTKFQVNLRIRTAITFVDGTLRAAYNFFVKK